MTETSLRCCPLTTDISAAAEILRTGGLVAIPTETVYGLGANALSEQAVARVFAAKDRPFFDPLIVHVISHEWLQRLVSHMPATAVVLAERFWPGPLTMVLPKTDLVPDLVTSGLPHVAIRMPSHPVTRALLEMVDLPIAAPSANPFGQLSPTCAQHVADTLGSKIDLILDGGACQVGVESTVVFVTDDGVQILRHGGITREQLEQVVAVHERPAETTPQAAASPGMLPQHYAPRTPLRVLKDASELSDCAELQSKRLGVLLLTNTSLPTSAAATEVLTKDGNLEEAATGFFAALRRLDHAGVDVIVAFPFPEIGLGRALNDRLQRAAHV